MAPKAKWTILTYIAAHNNLHYLGKHSYDQIIVVGSTPEVKHGILFDWPVGAARYIVGDPGLVQQQEQLDTYDSGDPDRLIETAQWVFDQHPAERYGLVLWSHGSGWEPAEIEAVTKEVRPGAPADQAESRQRSSAPGSRALFRSTLRALLKPDKPAERAILFDDGTGHSLDMLELSRVVNTIAEAVGQPIEFLGMDACLMGNLEVAYELRNAVRYLVASEELVPGHSWPYGVIFGALRANPDQGGTDLAGLVVNSYTSFYTKNPPAAGDVTKIGLDLNRIGDVTCRLNSLADALLPEIDSQADVLWKAQTATIQRETSRGAREKSKFDYHLWDLGTLSRELSTATRAPGVKAAAQSLLEVLAPGKGAVIAEGHYGSWFDGIAGATVYLVRPPTRISPHYARLSLARDTRWLELLSAYQQVYA